MVLLALGVWATRRWALTTAVDASVRTVKGIAKGLPEPHERDRQPDNDLLFPLWPLNPGVQLPADLPAESGADPASPMKEASPVKKRNASPKLGPPPKSTRASVKQVLGWAEQQIVPRGITRPQADGIPAGIELYDVDGLGLGLYPGDRLVTVDGISVLDRSQVVGAVLGARSRRAETMTAGLVRRTKDGPVRFTVVVEQPYPEDVPDFGEASDSSP